MILYSIAEGDVQKEIYSHGAARGSAGFSNDASHFRHSLAEMETARNNTPSALRSAERSDSKPLAEALFDARSSAKIIASHVAMHLDGEWRKRLFSYLDSLHDPAEWEAGDKPLSAESFQTFLKALLALHAGRFPGLGLSHRGNIIAAWVKGKDRLIIEFYPDNRARWTLSRSRGKETVRYAGDAPVSYLKEDLSVHDLDHWLQR